MKPEKLVQIPNLIEINPETFVCSFDCTIPSISHNKPAATPQIIQSPALEPEKPAELAVINTNDITNMFVSKEARMLSRHIVFLDTEMTAPVDYAKGKVLEDSISILPETLSLYADHIPSVNYLLGHAENFFYDYSTKPDGIGGKINVNKVASNSKDIAIHFAAGSANRLSITLTYKCSFSHNMKYKEFFENWGKTVDNQLVRLVVEEIKRYYELSLVWAGADPSAVTQKLEHYADVFKSKLPKTVYVEQKINKKTQEVTMDDEDIQAVLEMATKALGKEFSTVDQLKVFLTKLKKERDGLISQVESLEAELEELKPLQELSQKAIEEKRNEVTRLQKLSSGGEVDTLQQEVIQTAGYEKLGEMITSLESKLDSLVPLKCQDCGSTNVTRLSSQDTLPKKSEKRQKLKPIKYGFSKEK